MEISERTRWSVQGEATAVTPSQVRFTFKPNSCSGVWQPCWSRPLFSARQDHQCAGLDSRVRRSTTVLSYPFLTIQTNLTTILLLEYSCLHAYCSPHLAANRDLKHLIQIKISRHIMIVDKDVINISKTNSTCSKNFYLKVRS